MLLHPCLLEMKSAPVVSVNPTALLRTYTNLGTTQHTLLSIISCIILCSLELPTLLLSWLPKWVDRSYFVLPLQRVIP